VPWIRAQLDLAEFSPRRGSATDSFRLVPAQHRGTKQSESAILDCRHRLPTRRRKAEEFINLAHGLRFGRLWSHTSSGTRPIEAVNLDRLFMTQ
jgi:hypothetical protein